MNPIPFDTTPYSLSAVGNGLPWMGDFIPLDKILRMFYDVHRFRVYVAGINASQPDNSLVPTDATGGLTALGNTNTALGQSNASAAVGLTTRQMQVPPQILIEIADARRKANALDASQTDKDKLNKLLTTAQTTGAPNESKNFLRAIDITTKGAYPIHTFTKNLISLRIDFGSVKMLRTNQSFPADRTIIPTYNRYTSPLFSPAVYAVVGTVAKMVDAYLVGYLSLNIENSGGYLIGLYGSNPNTTFVNGSIYAREFYSDLNLHPSSGAAGTTVEIKVEKDPTESNPSKKKCFSGFKNVKRVSFNGFDVTNSFVFKTENLGVDPIIKTQVVNESCSVVVPSGAQSGYFTFYTESTDQGAGAATCNQFTVPQKFVVTS